MKALLTEILILFLLSGCASGKFSVNGGKAQLSIPFDFPNMEEQELRRKKMIEEMEKIELEMAQGDNKPLASKDE
jgi:PBP1b-binding outer membrane lipoprotein LpoB